MPGPWPGLLLGLLLAGAPALAGGPAADGPDFWIPPPGAGDLELLGPLGGWTTEGIDAQVRLNLAGDPRPRNDGASWDYWEQEQARREAVIRARLKELLPGEPAANWKLVKLLDWDGEDGEVETSKRPLARPEAIAFLARYAKARAQVDRELAEASDACSRGLLGWFNGQDLELRAELNRSSSLSLEPQSGENRLELLDPATGQGVVRTWWHEAAAGPRLQVRVLGESSVRVLAPDGKLSAASGSYSLADPAPGTYSLTWGDYRASHSRWWSPDAAAPVPVRVEVFLDAGTDRERRQSFTALCLPGGGEVALGSFDVTD
jgi:hypothetical protein